MTSKKTSRQVQQASEHSKRTIRNRTPIANSNLLFQFKITLLETKPPIWRRIQVPDCTLAKLHEVIQAAMGWENDHLHQFTVKGSRYGIPDPMGFDFGPKINDENNVLLSQIIPKNAKQLRFKYEYDFGDGWLHELLFEGLPPIENHQTYPVCLDGSRACPPEDCGGPYGYAEFLEAMADPNHERHEALFEWIGGEFDPEKVDLKKAAKVMQKMVR